METDKSKNCAARISVVHNARHGHNSTVIFPVLQKDVWGETGPYFFSVDSVSLDMLNIFVK